MPRICRDSVNFCRPGVQPLRCEHNHCIRDLFTQQALFETCTRALRKSRAPRRPVVLSQNLRRPERWRLYAFGAIALRNVVLRNVGKIRRLLRVLRRRACSHAESAQEQREKHLHFECSSNAARAKSIQLAFSLSCSLHFPPGPRTLLPGFFVFFCR